MNADGYSDVIVGAFEYDGGGIDEGRVWVYLGNEGRDGVIQGLQQRSRNDARPLSLLGSTDASGLFRIHGEFSGDGIGLALSSPGTVTAHLEWEVKPLGVPFDGTGIQSGAQQPITGVGNLIFDELATTDHASGHARSTRAMSFCWRARVATSHPLFPHTAWFSAPGSSVTEAKLRKPALQFP